MLALTLGGRTVAEWQASMSQVEFQAWIAYYKQHPFDDLHRYYRPAAGIMSTQGVETVKALEFLEPEPLPEGYSEADLNTFKALGIKRPPRKG